VISSFLLGITSASSSIVIAFLFFGFLVARLASSCARTSGGGFSGIASEDVYGFPHYKDVSNKVCYGDNNQPHHCAI